MYSCQLNTKNSCVVNTYKIFIKIIYSTWVLSTTFKSSNNINNTPKKICALIYENQL